MTTAAELAPALVASGRAHQREGRLSPAESCLLAALRLDPGNAEATYLMGVLALQAGNGQGAIAYLSRVVERRAGDADALYNMGMAHVLDFDLDRAETWFRRALAVNPRHTGSRFGLGNLARLLGRDEEWPEHYLAAMRWPDATAPMVSNALLALHSSPSVSLEELYALHREWERRFAAPAYARRQPHRNDRDAGRPLRIGFVTSAFNAEIVGRYLRGVLAALASRSEAQVHLYANSTSRDWVAEALEQGHRGGSIASLSDDQAAARIRADGIDILVDLNGHAPGHRLLVFALRPAPVQISWLDYFDTTGLEAIDYLITDPVSTPPDGAQRFAERLMHMPVRLCFTASSTSPAVAPSPALRGSGVTFGSFTRADKVTGEVVSTWARILAAVPGSRLILKGETLKFPRVQARFEGAFARAGVDPARLELRTPSPHHELLAEYADIDVALDTFPYNGGATTCDALWMGVPVVAKMGESMISRQSGMMLRAVGASQLVAGDDDQYVEIAASLARDPQRLAELRSGLRSAMADSPLCDAERFADALLLEVRRAWREWCAA